ncbi:uncharacterized protein LOC111386063 [Olea europaea var. sylvestris]|uniref:uncharacterized protein LOC111386063 n=1 Tax=Olea europaea var. sylvestris TaxID=158386 RepID=UPI000C1D81BE|nr:uncharacterized protein LOC111386063 [Olea europaea var. sylvestris]
MLVKTRKKEESLPVGLSRAVSPFNLHDAEVTKICFGVSFKLKEIILLYTCSNMKLESCSRNMSSAKVSCFPLRILLELPSYFAPRSFFGVEDFLDDDNSRPYTYQKEKKSKNPNKHVSFKQRTVAYMEPFTLDVFISKRLVSASITHRVTSKQVAVTGTNSKDIKAVLKSRSDIPACLAVGRILADRAREADVYTASYTPRERDKFEGKIRAVVQSLIDSGIDIKVFLD